MGQRKIGHDGNLLTLRASAAATTNPHEGIHKEISLIPSLQLQVESKFV
jgi:hypothetical protein